MRLWLKKQTVFQVEYQYMPVDVQLTVNVLCLCVHLCVCVCVCVCTRVCVYVLRFIICTRTGRPESFRIQAMNYFNDTVSFGNNTPHWRDMKKSLLTSL